MALKIMGVFCLSSFLFCSFAFGQKLTGAIEGTIRDRDERPIPGAMLTASSPSLIGGKAIVYSGQDGSYRFPILSSGTYEVKLELQGFQIVVRKNIELSVGQTLTVPFTLEVAAVTEVVEVTEKPPLIDASTTAVSSTIPPEIIHNLPNINEIQFLMALTPGVSDDLVAYGAGDRDSSFLVDGVNVSGRDYGPVYSIQYDYNWIQEVQVAGIGAPAEYGAFTGVVGNFTMRSGGNQFHGLFDTFFQDENLTSRNVPSSFPEQPFKTYDVSAQLGGPILRDKLWFFSGFQYPHTQTPTPGFDELTTQIYKKFITKLTFKLDEDNTLQGFVHRNNSFFEREGSSAYNLPEANYSKIENPEWSWNTTWISIFSSQTTFEGRLSGWNDNENDIEENPDLPAHQEITTGIGSVNNAARYENNRKRIQFNAALTHHADDFIKGGHDFRFGIEYERSTRILSYQTNGGMRYYDYYGQPYSRILGYSYITQDLMQRVSSYAQDNWRINNRLNLSLGVRWDHNSGGDAERNTVFRTDPVAPRIGFVWTLDHENQTVIKAHYGDYYESLLTGHFIILSGSTIEYDPKIYEQYIDGKWVETSREPPPGDDSLHVGGLKQPYVRQFTIGIDKILPKNIPIGAHYIYRRWGNILGRFGQSEYEPLPFVNFLDGEVITVYNRITDPESGFKNVQGAYRRYDGVEVFVSKQFNKLSLSGSFVYSKLTGNFPDGVFLFDDPNALINAKGRFGIDRPISWKIVGTWALPLGFNTGFYLRHESGNSWTATVPVRGLNQGPYRIYAEPHGSRRLPSRTPLDMRVEKGFLVYTGQLRFTVDVFNVFNSAYPLEVRDNFSSDDFGAPTEYNQPRTMRIGIRYTF